MRITKKNHKELEAKAFIDFLAPYKGDTETMYEADIMMFFNWLDKEGITIHLLATQGDIERFGNYLSVVRKNRPASVKRRLGVICRFYDLCHNTGVISVNPGARVRKPSAYYDDSARFGMNRLDMSLLLEAAIKRSPQDGALVCLLMVMGLRVTTACSFNVGDINDIEHGHRVLRYITKAEKVAKAPIPAPVGRILDATAEGRKPHEPLITRRSGRRMDRHAAYARLQILVREANLPPGVIHPHTLRSSAITAALDAGLSVRDVQQFANHADARTTLRYDNNAKNLDKHPSYVLAGMINVPKL